jgi:hypothetical protein
MMHPCIHLATKTIHRRVGYHAASFIMQLPVSASFTTTTTTRTSIDKSQQAIEKAEQLHKELNQLIKAQKTRQVEEAQRPFGSGVVTFLKNSKSEMFNIFFAFVCGECIFLVSCGNCLLSLVFLCFFFFTLK